MPSSYLAPKGTPVTLLEFEHGGATLIAETFGEGPHTFLLLHGIGMGRSVYLDVVQRLRGRVIALDLPGFGEAPEPTRNLTMERHAHLVAAYLRHGDAEPVVVIGHSMGSQIGAELAAQASYLLSDLVGERPLVIWRGAREYLRGGPHLIRKMRATIVHQPEKAFARIDCPVLVLRGEDDPLAPMSWCQEIIDEIPGAELRVIPDHGHGTLITDSEPAARLIQAFADAL